jgi:subtilisin family serine protease
MAVGGTPAKGEGLHLMRRFALIFAMLALVGTATAQVSAQSGGTFDKGGIFVVQMADLPVVAYDGSIKGFAATKPAPGTKINPLSAVVTKYVGYLEGTHDAALSRAGVGAAKKLYDYFYTYNGFAAKLTAQQANRLAGDQRVLAVSRNERFDVDTSSTPTFLELDAEGGLWEQLGGPTGNKNKLSGAGDGIIIGDIDSGIWPESLSFSDRDENGKLIYQQIPGWHGKCVPGEQFTATLCNQKLIGGQYFNASHGGNAGINADRPWEFNSVRDYNGHGTHTASTAGGNYGVPTTGPTAVFGAISGMAPRARIAAYKALWSTEDASTASGFTADLVAAIDQAVSDGVDVINYSISGTSTNFADPVEISFLFAANAGIFVSESAGNSGPTASTVAHPSPWTTTVAAGTHNRAGNGSVTLGNGVTYYGASVATPVGPVALIDSVNAGVSGANATHLALCYGATDGDVVLDPAKVAGKIVVCDRGVTARVNKSLAVQQAGGVGMILVNTSLNSINADFHFVPTVHLQSTDRAAVKAYAATASPTATINQATITYSEPAPLTASFSSRGPLLAGGGDLLKPDVIAPGQDILAAVAPPGNHGMDFNLYSGTSMSAPHVAGIAALLKDLHPTWSPAMIKSALMTSAYDVLDPVSTPSKIFRQGAGHIKPNSAANPGLVYQNGWNDWLAFLCGTTSAVGPSTCAALAGLGFSLDPSDFNGASIAIGDLAGVQTVHRKVTSVGSDSEQYTFSYTGLAGIDVTPSTSSFTINPGNSQSFNVTFTTNGAALNTYAGGFITWTGNQGHVVRIPVVVKPVALAAPAGVSSTGGDINYDVTFGYTGSFTATPRGLIPAVVTPGTVPQDPNQSFAGCGDTVGLVMIPVVVPAGTTYARFNLFDADVDAGSDIDLYVCRGSTLVGTSGSGTSAEQVSLVDPTAGTYDVYVHGWGPANGVSTPFKLYAWVLGTADAGNMAVSAPASATLGATGTITLSFSGLAANTKYLGSVAYSGAAGMPNPTIVRVDTP